MDAFAAIVGELRCEFRTFRLVPKHRSLIMQAAYYGLFMFLWCPRFMTHYTTVLVSAVYMPADLIGTEIGYRVLRHERVHMRDCFRTGILPFLFSYAFLLPAVFTMRSLWEMRGYTETMRAALEREGGIPDELVRHIEFQFTSSAYLYMFPFPRVVRRWVQRTRDRLLVEHGRRVENDRVLG